MKKQHEGKSEGQNKQTSAMSVVVTQDLHPQAIYKNDCNSQVTGDNSTTSITVSIEDSIITEGKIIHFKNMKTTAKVEILNAVGVQIFDGYIQAGTHSLDLRNISSGVYTLRLYCGDCIVSKKIHLIR